MEQKDYLTRQIDQIGILVGNLVKKMLALKGGAADNGYEMARHAFREQLDVDLETLLNTPDEEFISTLEAMDGFNNTNLEKMSALLLALAGTDGMEHAPDLYRKALSLLEYLERKENVFSFERQWKIEKIKKLMHDSGQG